MLRYDNFTSSYIVTSVERLSCIFLWEQNPSSVSLKMPSDSVVWVSTLVRMDVHNSSMQFIRSMGLKLEGLWISVLLGL